MDDVTAPEGQPRAVSGGQVSGRVALVTGGSRGVGRAIAQRLAAEGASVAVNYRRDEQAAAEAVKAMEQAGGRAMAYRAAVDDTDAVAGMLDAVRVDLGDVDIFVSNAGTASRGNSIAATDSAEFLRLLTVHALAPISLLQQLIPAMRQRGRADVVMISSATTEHAPVNSAPYTMAKAAMEMAARTLAHEERPYGVRVNIVAPDLVATDMGERLVHAVGGGRALSSLDESYPFGRVCRPEDVAGVVAFLVSSDGDYVSGQRIIVNGGGHTAPLVATT